MDTCVVETGLLRKKPCGHAAVAKCLNCEIPLCLAHAVAQLNESGKKSGKFMCQECVAAAKEREKSLAAAARHQQEKKFAEIEKSAREALGKPLPTRKPVAPAAPAPAAGAKE